MYLLDTNVVSELRNPRKAEKKVKVWATSVAPNSVYISAITILELEMGILQIERRDNKQGALLRAWLENKVLPAFDHRILPVDTAVALRCAKLHVPNPHSERDALIAATGLVHGLTVVTRNVADFKSAGVRLLNPWG